MFDVFYTGKKPNLFAHEQAANSLEHARSMCRTRMFWWVNYLSDYTGFDFLWEPVPWQSHQAHVWASAYQIDGGTWLVPREGYQDVNYHSDIVPRRSSVPILGIDHGGHELPPVEYSTRFISDYLGTLRRLLSRTNHEYVWVVSSVCDYTNFDFNWHPSPWQDRMLHVFPSDQQKFGDTFYVHVPSFLERSRDIKLLEWFETLNFVKEMRVPRRPWPVVHHEHDSQVPAVWQYHFKTPVAEFTRYEPADYQPPTNLWREETRTIYALNRGYAAALIPRDAKNYLKTQLYDYPYIDTQPSKSQASWARNHALDVVFISNGEPCRDQNFSSLGRSLYGKNNSLYHVQDVDGRVAAYQAAARASSTDWFFAVFAKLKVESNFDWAWQPDRLQPAKHYIFNAHNPVNGLTYGHQAMIAYNRRMVLENTGSGLDFTLDQPHAVVPLLSGETTYHYSDWMCWRTAFREVIKLRHDPTPENRWRLTQWLKPTNLDKVWGDQSEEWSQRGAEDGVEYYDEVKGDFDQLKKSYEWRWLASYALIKRGLVPD
jgi:hypothetical protein